MFELGRVDDLLAPRSPSTGRALDSYVRRTTFEALKRAVLQVDSAPDGVRSALRELRDSFAARLPGDPHAIAGAIAIPAIGVLLREGLARVDRGDDPRALATGIARLRAFLGDAAQADVATRVTVEGRIAFRVDDRELERCVGVTPSPIRDEHLLAARGALSILLQIAPAIRADADRFTSTLLATPVPLHRLPVSAIGIGCVAPTVDMSSTIAAFVLGVSNGKLSALDDARIARTEPLARFRQGASHAASAAVLHQAIARKLLDPTSTDPELLRVPPPPDVAPAAVAFAGVFDEWTEIFARTNRH